LRFVPSYPPISGMPTGVPDVGPASQDNRDYSVRDFYGSAHRKMLVGPAERYDGNGTHRYHGRKTLHYNSSKSPPRFYKVRHSILPRALLV
jgi:hypothetical protein